MGSDEIYEGFKYQILWNPMGSDEIYEGFKYQILWNQMGSDEIYDGFKYQILWNPMGSDEIYDGFKYQIQSCLLLRGDFLGTSYLLGGGLLIRCWHYIGWLQCAEP